VGGRGGGGVVMVFWLEGEGNRLNRKGQRLDKRDREPRGSLSPNVSSCLGLLYENCCAADRPNNCVQYFFASHLCTVY
jgi:hypothetical protein